MKDTVERVIEADSQSELTAMLAGPPRVNPPLHYLATRLNHTLRRGGGLYQNQCQWRKNGGLNLP